MKDPKLCGNFADAKPLRSAPFFLVLAHFMLSGIITLLCSILDRFLFNGLNKIINQFIDNKIDTKVMDHEKDEIFDQAVR